MKTTFRQLLDNLHPKLKFVLAALALLGVAYLIELITTSTTWSLAEDAVRLGDSFSNYGLRNNLIWFVQLCYTVGVSFLLAWLIPYAKDSGKKTTLRFFAAGLILFTMTLAHRCYVGIERVGFDFLHGVNNGAFSGYWLMPRDRFDAIGDIFYAILVFYLARRLARRYFGSGPVSAASAETGAVKAAGVTATPDSADAKFASAA